MNSILKELEEMRKINENLNIEIVNLRNEKTSNLDNSCDEKKKAAEENKGFNLHTFLDEQYSKQNSNVLNMREIFIRCNTLKKKFSHKSTSINNLINNQNCLNTFTRDPSFGSRNSNISVRVNDNNDNNMFKNSSVELNGVSKSHIPIPPKKNTNMKRCGF